LPRPRPSPGRRTAARKREGLKALVANEVARRRSLARVVNLVKLVVLVKAVRIVSLASAPIAADAMSLHPKNSPSRSLRGSSEPSLRSRPIFAFQLCYFDVIGNEK
jgi:hypothetical protein